MGIGGIDEFLGNSYDTNDNSNDFVIREISQPQNTSSDKQDPTMLTPTPSEEPTPTQTTPEATPTPKPTVEPTITPIPTTAQPTPTPSAQPTITPEISPFPQSTIIGVFNFPGKTKICQLHYQSKFIKFLTIFFFKN